jgi:hypothetical protein
MAEATGFPHSDISGSKVARHLPEAYRRHAASFITSLESRHPPYALKFLIRKFKNHVLNSLYKKELIFSVLLNGIKITFSILLIDVISDIDFLPTYMIQRPLNYWLGNAEILIRWN